jgi:type VI protein secretion system component VasF
LRRVIDDLNLELHPEMYSSIDIISPNARPKDMLVQASNSGLPTWVFPIAAVIVFLIFYFIMSASISSSTSDVAEMLKNLIS